MFNRTTILVAAALALAAAGQARAQSRDPRVDKAFQALQSGDGERAAAGFRDVLSDNPRDPVLNLGAGAAAHMMGRDDQARTYLMRALEGEPRLTPASSLLAEIAYAQGDVDLAIRTYEDALKYAPANGAIRKRLADLRAEAAMPRQSDGPFTIVFEGHAEEQLGAHATSILNSAYWRIGRALGAYPPDPITVVLYANQTFYDVTGAPEWSGGSFDTRIRIPVRGALKDLRLFDRVLTHELAHAMISSLADRGVPGWLHEGLATYLEPESAPAAAERLKTARIYVPLENLAGGFGRLSDRQAAIAYDESLVAAGALMQRVGAGVSVLLQALGRGTAFETAVEEFGFSYTEFENDLKRTLNQPLRSANRDK